MSDSPLVENVKKIVAQRNKERGQGRTQRFMHNHDFPSIVDLEEVAGGLIGDISGQEDILERAALVSEDASLDMILAKLNTVLRARLFTLAATVLPQFKKEARENKTTEWELNVLLRLMAEAQPPVIYQEHEALALRNGVNQSNGTEWTTEGVMDWAIKVLNKACRHEYRNGAEYELQGLVPVRVDRGITLNFVPVRQVD